MCLEQHPLTLAANLAHMIYTMLSKASTSKIPAEDGNKKSYMTRSICKKIKLECIKVCMKASTASLLNGVLYVLLGSWDVCHKGGQEIMKQKPPSNLSNSMIL